MWTLRPTKLFLVIYKFLRSIKLASVLILYLIGLSIWTSVSSEGVLPGGANPVAALFLVVVPVVLFAMNLVVCATARVVGRVRAGSYLRRKGWLTLGPDLVHISLLLFLIGGLMSHFGRIDGEVRLAAGEFAVLNERYMLRLEEFNIEFYPDGRPKQYVSAVQLLQRQPGEAEAAVIDTAEITVNNPYSFGRLKIYQRSYTGAGLNGPGREGTRSDGAPGKNARELASVLQAVYDPGYPAILAGMLLFLFGISLVAADKLVSAEGRRTTEENPC